MTAAGLLTFLGTSVWLGWHAHQELKTPRANSIYTAQGYGGYTASPPSSKPISTAAKTGAASPVTRNPLRPLNDAYNAGRYLQAETQAQAVIQEAAGSHSVKQHTQAAFARQILAYSAARRHDLPLARVRFAAMQTAAAHLPDKGLETAPPGEIAPTLEAEAAFQHAVCTGALGDKAGAEAEYIAFMKEFPDSPLLHATVMRLEKLHGGDMSPAEEGVWRQAMQTTQAHQRTKERDAALCGPECLAELLRRQGEKADVHTLADQMGTTARGTSLSGMADAAWKHGWPGRGLALTPEGLAKQRLPAIALIRPGHYVLVEAYSPQQVTLWDPDAHGVGHGSQQRVTPAQWRQAWSGLALALPSP